MATPYASAYLEYYRQAGASPSTLKYGEWLKQKGRGKKKTMRTKQVESQLSASGLTAEEIARLGR